MKFLAKNPILKIISLILAIILWLFVKSERTGDVGLVVPLELHGLSSRLIVTRMTVEAISVRISGPLSQLEKLVAREIRARINLSYATHGSNLVDILPKDLTIPQGFTVSQISPSSVKIEVDRVGNKIVHVKVTAAGRPAKGYRVTRISVDPPYVNLEGAQGQLNTVNEISTEEVDISDLKESVSVDVPLRLADLKLTQGMEKKVKVFVEIKEKKGK